MLKSQINIKPNTLIDLTNLSKDFLESQVIPPDTIKIIKNCEDFLERLDSYDNIDDNEKIFVKWVVRYRINYLRYDYNTWEKMAMGVKLYEHVLMKSEYLERVYSKIEELAKMDIVASMEIENLQIRFFFWDFCENFDDFIKDIPVYQTKDKTYTKSDWMNTFMNYQQYLNTDDKSVKSTTLNIGQKKRLKLHIDPELSKFFNDQIEKAKLLHGGISVLGKIVGKNNLNTKKIKLLGSYRNSKTRKEMFKGICSDFELKGRNSLNQKMIFLYDLFSLIFSQFPTDENMYDKLSEIKKKENPNYEQDFRDFKIGVIRNLVSG